MVLCQSHYHAQVPVTNLNLLLSYCHPCQAWTVIASRHTSYDDSPVAPDNEYYDHLGPFDGAHGAYTHAVARLLDLFDGSGLPWDIRQGWSTDTIDSEDPPARS